MAVLAFKKVFLKQKLNLVHQGENADFYFLTMLMEGCIEMTITSMYSYYNFLFFHFNIKIKKIFTQGSNSVLFSIYQYQLYFMSSD